MRLCGAFEAASPLGASIPKSVDVPPLEATPSVTVLQPISSHLGLATALVLSPDVKLEFKVQTDHQAILSIDGQMEIALGSGDRVKVSRSPHVTRFLRAQPPGFFYRTLMQRLRSR